MLRTHYANQLGKAMEGTDVVLAGWVHEVRNIGKISFLLLRDHTGIVQITAKKGEVQETVIKSMDLQKESVILVRGTVKLSTESKSGFEITPVEITNLNPVSGQIPFEVTGKVPADLDVRLDNRHIDLRRSESTAVFNIQSTILKSFRNVLVENGFQEMVPTCLVEAATEGGADMFEVKYFDRKAYLGQSPQLYKQLAVIGGMDRVFMTTPIFRAEKSNTLFHLNESTQMDIEMGFADHNDAIEVLKKVIVRIVSDVNESNSGDLRTLGAKPASKNIKEVTYSDAVKALSEAGSRIKQGEDLSKADEEMLEGLFGEIVIIRDYPTDIRAFYSMPSGSNPKVSNSFDLIFRGVEVCSGAQRIHNADLLVNAIKSRGLNPMDFEFYINAFRQGAPPHAGWSIGLERLTMKIAGVHNVRECSMFPRDRNRVRP